MIFTVVLLLAALSLVVVIGIWREGVMIVEKSPASERSQPRSFMAERLGEVELQGDLPLPRTSPLLCQACDNPAAVRYRGLWCSAHAMLRLWLLPALEWNWKYAD